MRVRFLHLLTHLLSFNAAAPVPDLDGSILPRFRTRPYLSVPETAGSNGGKARLRAFIDAEARGVSVYGGEEYVGCISPSLVDPYCIKANGLSVSLLLLILQFSGEVIVSELRLRRSANCSCLCSYVSA